VPVTISSATTGPNEEQRRIEHKAKMLEVAKLITGDNAPPYWLRDLLFDWSFKVKSSHSIEKILPTKKQLSKRLWSIEKLAMELSELLESPMTSGFLTVGAGRESESYIRDGVLPTLSMLTMDARKARNSSRLITPEGNVQPGRGRPHLPGNMPPKYVCSAIIAEVWSFFHQDADPTPTDRQAQTATARFFDAWFKPDGWGTDKLKGWKTYLESIDDPELQAIRKDVRRHLKIHARSEAARVAENNAQ
jgi:hypothetical protein